MATNKEKDKVIRGVTPKGVAIYPWLTTPDTKFNKNGDYRVTLKLEAADAEAFKETIDNAIADVEEKTKAELNGKLKEATTGKEKAKLKKALESMRVLVPYKESVDDEGDPTGDYEFNFKSAASFTDSKTGKVIPRTLKIFDAKKKEITGNVAIFGGSIIKVAYMVSPYYIAAQDAVGVKLLMNAVQVIELNSGAAGGTADSYGFDEEDGYTGEESTEEESSNSTGTDEPSDSDEEENDDF
jgi:hypothetical protein